MSEELDNVIEQAASDPAQVTVDGTSVSSQDISKLIEADKYLAGKRAAASRRLPFTIGRIRPPGAV